MTAGYSGTPLARKLSLKEGMRVRFEAMPGTVRAEIDGAGLVLAPAENAIDAAHIFITGRTELKDSLERLLPLLARDGQIWVSWPKKASKLPTDVTEDVVREVALPMGLVDVKVCAVDETWSGLKLVIRKALR
jgi:hypothetical protein